MRDRRQPPVLATANAPGGQVHRSDQEHELADHKFKTGQSVEVRGATGSWMPSGIYKVVQPLPSNGRENQYRLKSVKDGHERVVVESDVNTAH